MKRMKKSRLREQYPGLVLSGNIPNQIGLIGKELFHEDGSTPSTEISQWKITDGLFHDSNSSYSEIINILSDKPKTYKLEHVKLKMLGKLPQAIASSDVCLDKAEENIVATDLETDEDGTEGTFLNPFNLPYPWETHEDEFGRITYHNRVTRKTNLVPPEIWEDKLDLLEKIIPRDDGKGFIYRESDEDRRRRNRAAQQLITSSQAEVRRRALHPNEEEQVEDVLQRLVDRVVRKAKTHGSGFSDPTVSHPALRRGRLTRLPALGLSDTGQGDITDAAAAENAHVSDDGTVTSGLPCSSARLVINALIYGPIVANKNHAGAMHKERKLLEDYLVVALAEAMYISASCLEIEQVITLGEDVLPDMHAAVMEKSQTGLKLPLISSNNVFHEAEERNEESVSFASPIADIVARSGADAAVAAAAVVDTILDCELEKTIRLRLHRPLPERSEENRLDFDPISLPNRIIDAKMSQLIAKFNHEKLSQENTREVVSRIVFPVINRAKEVIGNRRELTKDCNASRISFRVYTDASMSKHRLDAFDVVGHFKSTKRCFIRIGDAEVGITSMEIQRVNPAPFIDWMSYLKHFMTPVYFGYSVSLDKDIKTDHSSKTDRAIAAVHLISPSECLSSGALETLQILKVPVSNVPACKQHSTQLPIRVSSLDKHKLAILHELMTSAEKALIDYQKKKRSPATGLTRDELKLQTQRDNAVKKFTNAKKRLEQVEEDVSLHNSKTSIMFEESIAEFSEFSANHVNQLIQKKDALKQKREKRNHDKSLLTKINGQRGWFINNLIQKSFDPLRMKAELGEEIRKREDILKHVDIAYGVSEAVINDIKKTKAIEHMQDIDEKRRTRQLFHLALRQYQEPGNNTFDESIHKNSQDLSHYTPSITIKFFIHFIEESFQNMENALQDKKSRIASIKLVEKEKAAERRRSQLQDIRARVSTRGLRSSFSAEPTEEAGQVYAEPEEFQILRLLRWPLILATNTIFKECLTNLPTLLCGCINEEELAQFASIMLYVEPLYASALGRLEQGTTSKEITKNQSLSRLNPSSTDKLADIISETEALQYEISRKERNKYDAIRDAHQHTYIMIENVLHCIICLQKKHEHWYCVAQKQEILHRDAFKEIFKEACAEYSSRLNQVLELPPISIPLSDRDMSRMEWRNVGHFMTLVERQDLSNKSLIKLTYNSRRPNSAHKNEHAMLISDKSCPETPRYPSILIKVWSWNAFIDNILLGQLELSSQVILQAPSGIRFYNLDAVSNSANLSQQIALRISFVDKNIRIDVICAKSLRCVDDEALSNPFIEFYWKGIGIKAVKEEIIPDWTLVGQTVPLGHTLNPSWGLGLGNQTILPPVWQDGPVFFLDRRSKNWLGMLNYGWVSKNYNSSIFTSTRTNSILSLIEARQDKPERQAGKNVTERELRLQHFKDSVLRNEEERRQMWEEEVDTKYLDLGILLSTFSSQIQEQKRLSKEFNQMQSSLQHKSNLLGRLRFMLGESFGECISCYCMDPASGNTVRLFLLAAKYSEDETELKRQIEILLYTKIPHVLKIMEFALLTLRNFTYTGFSYSTQKCAAIITNEESGIPMDDYMTHNLQSITNEVFRDYLLQIISAFVLLHEAGILHRNLYPACVLIRNDNNKQICVVRDFFFLFNCRILGCSYSQSRADWGNADIIPPEIYTGIVNDKSDVYAFGVCVYMWAMTGSARNYVAHSRGAVAMSKSLPPRWNPWISTLLKLCTESRHDVRASAKDVQNYLLGTRVNKFA